MARLRSIGFELNSVTAGVELSSIVGSPTISTTTVRSGTYALRSLNGTNGFEYQFNHANQTAGFYARVYVYFATLPNANNNLIAFRNASPSGKIAVRFLTATNELILYNIEDSAQIGSGSQVVTTGQWYRIELFTDTTTIASTTATFRVDGVQIETGTANLATGICKLLVQGFGTTSDVFFDDIAINDTNGSNQNSWPGEGKVIVLRPNAAGDSNTFGNQTGGTAGAANNFTRVNEVTPDDATTFNGSGTVNQEDLFNVDASGLTSGDTINVVAVGVRVRNGTSPDSTMVLKAEIEKTSGGTKIQGSAISPARTTWGTNDNATANNASNDTLVTYQDPDNNAWTNTTLDSMQIGYKLTTADVRTIDVSTVWASVDYTPGTPPASTSLPPFGRRMRGMGL